MSGTADSRYKVDILDACLFVRRVQISPTIANAHAKVMQTKNALYPIHRIEIDQATVPVGARVTSKDNFFGGRIPRRVIVALLSNDAVHGDLTKNPFNFQHFGLEELELSVDGEPVAGTPLTCNFDANLHVRAYYNMFHALNKGYKDAGLDISYSDFCNGYSLFCFDLTADGCGSSSEHFEVREDGRVRELRTACVDDVRVHVQRA
jgi:hypothetical protein